MISNLGIFIKVFTTFIAVEVTSTELWIDFKSWYIYQSIYNKSFISSGDCGVVNWFQILVYLSKYLQLLILNFLKSKSCELISNLGIFIKVFTTIWGDVVNLIRLWIDFKSWYIYQSIYNTPDWTVYPLLCCELISNLGIFIKVFTTYFNVNVWINELWIDFKSWYIYQSIYNICSFANNTPVVVNWFQILVYLSKYLQQKVNL